MGFSGNKKASGSGWRVRGKMNAWQCG